MTEETKNKLAKILNEVKDPENGLSVSRMGLVAGIKLKEETKEFQVYMYSIETDKACCVVFQLNVYATIEHALKEAIEGEFPGYKVVFRNP